MATDITEVEESEEDFLSGDGKPLAETPEHIDSLTLMLELLRIRFAGNDNVYIGGNMFVYYRRKPRRSVSPDVFLALGVPSERLEIRDSYFVWKEGKGPDVTIEITSRGTALEDQVEKFGIYRDMGVREYFLFDPLSEYLEPSFQGFRLVDGEYVEIEEVNHALPSEVIGMPLMRSGRLLRLFDPVAGRLIPTHREGEQAAELRAREAVAEQQRTATQLQNVQNQIREERAERQRMETRFATEMAEMRRLIESLRQPPRESQPEPDPT